MDDKTKTEMYCHDCDKDFIAVLNMKLDGQHIIVCPHCGHEHCRVIENGVVTGDRWSSRNNVVDTPVTKKTGTWTSDDNNMRTMTASIFLREKWLNI